MNEGNLDSATWWEGMNPQATQAGVKQGAPRLALLSSAGPPLEKRRTTFLAPYAPSSLLLSPLYASISTRHPILSISTFEQLFEINLASHSSTRLFFDL